MTVAEAAVRSAEPVAWGPVPAAVARRWQPAEEVARTLEVSVPGVLPVWKPEQGAGSAASTAKAPQHRLFWRRLRS